MFSRTQATLLFMVFSLILQLPSLLFAQDSHRDEPRIFAPKEKSGHLPLIVLLHGYAGNATIMNYYFGLDQVVQARKFVLVVPNGKIDHSGWRFWNATSACCDFDHSDSDDVGYLLTLIKDMKQKYKIDAKKVFVVGHSNGAFMAHRLACEPDSPVQAIVSFAGAGFLDAKDCHASHAVSVLQIHAVDDDTIHFEGDSVGYPKLAPYPSTDQTLAQWTSIDHCFANAEVGPALRLTRFASTDDADRLMWNNCSGGSQVELWKIHASDSFPHSPHSPFLRDDFAGTVLDFLGLH